MRRIVQRRMMTRTRLFATCRRALRIPLANEAMTPLEIQFLLQCFRILPRHEVADVGSIAWTRVGLIAGRGEQVTADSGDEVAG
jgi:hypothetical protein